MLHNPNLLLVYREIARYNKAMKHLLPVVIVIFLGVQIFFHTQFRASAQQKPPPSVTHAVSIGAQIGQYTVNLSGFIAPYASVVMTIDTTVVRSTVADANGYFFLSQIVVKGGFDHYCLTAVDVRRLGESKACFQVPPVTRDYTRSGIFLPPTLGLYKKQINAGQTAQAWGYSMPGAKVTLHLSDGRILTVTADQTGYYEFDPRFDNPGDYELFADASYNGQNSENPVDKLKLQALSLSSQVGNGLQNVGKNIWELLSGPIGFLLLAIPIIILIIILLRKLLQGRHPVLGGPKKPTQKVPFIFFKKKKLHHAWWVGY